MNRTHGLTKTPHKEHSTLKNPLNPTSPKTTLLTEFQENKKKLATIDEAINELVELLGTNHSWLSQLSAYWSTFALEQKIIIGAALIIPLLVIGLIANLAGLITLSVVALILYPACSMMLDNHVGHSQNTLNKLKAFIATYTHMIGEVTESLNKIRDGFKATLKAYISENRRLSQTIDSLDLEIKALSGQNEELIETSSTLMGIKTQLQQNILTLTSSIEKHKQLLAENQIMQEHTQKELDTLQEQISDLIGAKASLTTHNDELKLVVTTLQGVNETLSGVVIGDEQQRAQFQAKLNQFLNEKEARFESVAERIGQAEAELFMVKEALKASTTRFNQLLDTHEQLIQRIEQTHQSLPTSTRNEDMSSVAALKQKGFYAVVTPKIPQLDQESFAPIQVPAQ